MVYTPTSGIKLCVAWEAILMNSNCEAEIVLDNLHQTLSPVCTHSKRLNPAENDLSRIMVMTHNFFL